MNAFSRLRSDERGISAVVVAVSSIALIGALVLSLDTGSIFRSRRAAVTGTDAAALAGGKAAAFTTSSVAFGTSQPCPSDVQTAVVSQMTANEPDMTLEACTMTPTSKYVGYITVEGRKPTQSKFAGIFGAGNGTAYSNTSVQYGFPIAGQGLRPFAICLRNTHIQEWLHLKDPTLPNDANVNTPPNSFMPPWYARIGATPPASYQHNQAEYDDLPNTAPLEPDSSSIVRTSHTYCITAACNADSKINVVHRIYWDQALQEQCGPVPGNWGVLDFDGGSNPTQNDTNAWIREGFNDAQIGIGNCDIDNALPGTGTQCPGNPGALANANSNDLDKILNVPVQVVIFDSVGGTCGGGGGNCATYNVYAFVGVILRGYRVTGQEDNRYLDVEFTDLTLTGKCCADSANVITNSLAMAICSTDHDPVAASTRCAPTT